MADYVVHFEHYTTSDVTAQVTVPFAVAPEQAAAEYETIIEIAYGLLGQTEGFAGTDVNDMITMKITHNDDDVFVNFS